MDGGWTLLIDLMATLAGAFLLGLVMERVRLPAVLGYVLAGVVLGPGLAGVVTSVEAVRALSEIGVALLLFSIGLEFSWKQVLKLGRVGIGGGFLQVSLTLGVTWGIAGALGYDSNSGVALGAIVALSSTVIVLKALKERGDLDSTHGKACVGLLIFQDLAFVPLVLLLSALGGNFSTNLSADEVGSLVSQLLTGFLALVVIVVLFVPRAMRSRAMSRNRELPILLAVIVCMASAWAAHSAGFSASIGAFLGGVLLAGSTYADQIRADLGPLRTLFATVFFASVGMLADARWVAANIGLVLLVSVAIVLGKTVITFGALRAFKLTTIGSIAAGIALAQVGELSFVLLQSASNRNLIEPNLVQLLTSASVLTIAVCPLLVSAAPTFGRALAKRIVPARKLAREESEAREATRGLSDHILVTGFGEAGRAAVDGLRDFGYHVVVLETDRRLVGAVREAGCQALLGDASQADILEDAGLLHAKGLVVALSDHRSARLVTSQARRLAPHVPIVARARYHLFLDEIDAAGADRTVDEETLVGRKLADELHVLFGTVWDHEGRDRLT